MRYIVKTEPPKEYTDWIYRNTFNHKPPDFYDNYGKCKVPEDIRRKFKEHAIKDQNIL